MRGVCSAFLVAALLAGGGALAQEGAPPLVQSPILTLDQERVFTGTLWGKRVADRIETASSALAAENRRIEGELTAEEKALTERRPTLPDEEFRTAAAAFDAKVVEIRRAQDVKAREIGQMHDAERQRFYSAALPVMTEILRAHKAVAVLDSRAIFLAADAIDVTDEMIARIDETLGAGEDVPVPPAAAEGGN